MAPNWALRFSVNGRTYRYGGAYQYVLWANGSSILDFYTNPTLVGWYQNK